MKAALTRVEDLEFLRNIRGTFGSRQMWSVEYEFTGEEIIERRGGRIKNQIRLSEIIETRVLISTGQITLRTNSSKMTIRIIPSLNKAIQRETAKVMATKSEDEQRHFERVQQETISRLKRANVIGAIVLMLLGFAIALFVGWLTRKH